MKLYRLAGLLWAFLLPFGVVAQDEEAPPPEEDPEAIAEDGLFIEEEPAREVRLDRVLQVPSLGAEFQLAAGWLLQVDPLGGRRVRAKGPIEYGLQTSFTIWLVANDEVLGDFRNRFARFLKNSYPNFRLVSSPELDVGGKGAVSFRLEGELGREGGIRVPSVHAFTVVDRKRYKLIALLVWPREEDDYYTRFHAEVLKSVAFTGPVIYQRRTDGVVEVEEYIFRPLVDWGVAFEQVKEEEQKRTVDYVRLTAPTTAAELRYKLVRENVVSTPEEYARVKYEQYKEDELCKYVTLKNLQEGLSRVMLQVEMDGVPHWVMMFFSGRPGNIFVVTVHVPEHQWKDLRNSANQMGSTFSLRAYPREFIDFGLAGDEGEKEGEGGGPTEGEAGEPSREE